MKPKGSFVCKRILPVLLLLLLLAGCGSAPPDYYAYRNRDFCAELRGVRGELDFTAKLTVEQLSEGYGVTLEYLSPDSLKGLTVTGCCNANGELLDAVEIRTQDLLPAEHGAITSTAAQGLLAPAVSLLGLCDHTAVSLEQEQYRLTFSGGEHLLLNSDGQPIAWSSENAEFWIVWWKNGEKKEK